MIASQTNLESANRELHNIRHALDQSAIVAITDRAGTIIHVNEKFCEISGYTREELLGKNHRLLNSGHHSREFFSNLWTTISEGKIWEGEIKNLNKKGNTYWVHTTIVPFLDTNHKPYQYVSIRYEITQRKLAEEKLRIYAEKLELSNRELQDFASIAAHDLQEPLRKIQTFGDRLSTRFRNELNVDGQDFLTRMLSSAKRMRKLIDDLLTYSRITTQAQPFQLISLEEITREVLSDLEIQIEQSKAVIQLGALPTITADPSQLRQLMQNLIANALKFQKKGTPPIVTINAHIQDSHCSIHITDNGIGFDEKYLDRIFTIFQRLHGKQEYEGTGLGLAVCRRIVERHGGQITAKSSPNEGAQFMITLPLELKHTAITSSDNQVLINF
jgi:PAS domain S-box-containing protein